MNMNLPRLSCFVASLALAACSRSPVASHADATIAATPDMAAAAPSSISSSRQPSVKKSLPKDLEEYGAADVVVSGMLVEPKIVSVLEVDPPIYVHEFKIAVKGRIAGGSVPATIKATLSSRTQRKPFPANERVLVALMRIEGTLPAPTTRYEARRVDVATPELEATLASALTKAPDNLSLAVAQVPAPAGSPSEYGDGVFELKLRNEGSSPLVVPGVFVAGDSIQWANAIEVRDEDGRTLTLPRATVPDGSVPLRLKPQEEVKTTVDVRPFGVVLPIGGGRKTYSFAVGPLRTSSWFYYVHSYHGPMMGHP